MVLNRAMHHISTTRCCSHKRLWKFQIIYRKASLVECVSIGYRMQDNHEPLTLLCVTPQNGHKHALKILQHLLQDFKKVSDHYGAFKGWVIFPKGSQYLWMVPFIVAVKKNVLKIVLRRWYCTLVSPWRTYIF